MAEKIADLSGDDREKRVAELKRKMQEAAQKAQSAHSEDQPAAAAPVAVAPAAVAVASPVVVAEAAPAVEAVAESAPVVVAAESAPPAAPATNGVQAAAAPAPRPAPAAPRPVAAQAEADGESEGKGINRREFLTYAWGAALGLLGLEAGVATFLFLYPRFRVGEFGGDFPIDAAKFGNKDAAPNPEPSGKFWMVTTAEGKPKALYMVCVHLGCLYKWVPANNRFECPCHGSKYTHDGFYIEGPATRSLDTFEVDQEADKVIVHTGKKVLGDSADKSPARAAQA